VSSPSALGIGGFGRALVLLFWASKSQTFTANLHDFAFALDTTAFLTRSAPNTARVQAIAGRVAGPLAILYFNHC